MCSLYQQDVICKHWLFWLREIYSRNWKKRPAIYDKKLKACSDKNVKDKLWTEVYETMRDGWEEMEEEEKKNTRSDMEFKCLFLLICYVNIVYIYTA